MSEAEKKRRLDYKEKRRRGILIQSLILCGLCLLAVVSFIVYGQLDKTHYVGYDERGSVSYSVQMMPNQYYEQEWLPQGQAYVSALTDTVRADFSYDLAILEGEHATFTYTYDVTAQLVVADSTNKTAIFNPITSIRDDVTTTVSGDAAKVKEIVFFDFASYRAQAESFISTYDLTNAEGYALVTMYITVQGNGEGATPHSYHTQLKIPLTQKTFTPEQLTPALTVEDLILACASAYNPMVFFILFIVFLSLAGLGAIVLVLYIYATRNHDINYTIKLKKIVGAYKCYIQRIMSPFDTANYQVVALKTFTEMLDIRDTLGSPLLMYENEDHTSTSFLVPTAMGILYSFELRVGDYDAIYGTGDGTYIFEKNKLMLALEAIGHFFVTVTFAIGRFFARVGIAIGRFFARVGAAVGRFFARVGVAVGRFFARVAVAIARFFAFIAVSVARFFAFVGVAVGRFFKRLFTRKPKAEKEASVASQEGEDGEKTEETANTDAEGEADASEDATADADETAQEENGAPTPETEDGSSAGTAEEAKPEDAPAES